MTKKYKTTKSQKKNQKKKIFQRAKKLTYEAIILIRTFDRLKEN